MRLLAALLAVTLLAGCKPRERRLDVELPTADGKQNLNLSSCPAPKCLTVVVAPWCGYCRAATPMLLEARQALKADGVPTRIVIGMDTEESTLEYARAFGPDTLIDPPGDVGARSVPYFLVTTDGGFVSKSLVGVPPDVAALRNWVLTP